MTQHTTTPDADLIQRARDIAADTFVKIEAARGKKPSQFETFAKWGEHIDSYSKFMREGAYDNDIVVQSTLVALASSHVEIMVADAMLVTAPAIESAVQ